MQRRFGRRRFSDCDDGFGAVINDEMRRGAIALTFVEVFDAPPECEWEGRDGIISDLLRYHEMPDGSRDVVRRVLVDVVECHKARIQYNPARNLGSGGHNKIITLGSIEEQMVADHMESGLGLTQTTVLINLHRRESELEEVGRSAVYSSHLRLQKIQKSTT